MPRSLSRRALLKQTFAAALVLQMARVLNPPAARAGGGPLAHVQLLAINDFHGGITDRALGSRRAGGSVALAAHLALRRAGVAETVTVHAGDIIGASPPISGLLGDEPAITSMDLLGVELGTVGNHEFDRGLGALHRLQSGDCDQRDACFAGARMQYLAANVVHTGTGKPVFPPYAVRVVDGVGIGFVGCTLRDTPRIVTPAGVAGLDFLDEAETINRYTAGLRAQGVNAVVALIHQGGEGNTAGGPISGTEINRIVSSLDEAVGVVISGHTHRGYRGRIGGRLVTQAFAHGTALADIALTVDRTSGRILDTGADIITTYLDSITAEPDVAARVLAWQEEVRPLVERVVGETTGNITRATSAAGESALGNLIADSQRNALQTQMAFVNPGGIRDDLRAGVVTWGRLFAILPFGNDVNRMTLTGEQIARLLNQQWDNRDDPRILKTSGLRYTWNADDPERRVRLADIRLDDGSPLRARDRYTVAVNSFLASGGDRFSVFTEGQDVAAGPVDLDALVSYIESLPQPFSARTEQRILRRGDGKTLVASPPITRQDRATHHTGPADHPPIALPSAAGTAGTHRGC